MTMPCSITDDKRPTPYDKDETRNDAVFQVLLERFTHLGPVSAVAVEAENVFLDSFENHDQLYRLFKLFLTNPIEARLLGEKMAKQILTDHVEENVSKLSTHFDID